MLIAPQLVDPWCPVEVRPSFLGKDNFGWPQVPCLPNPPAESPPRTYAGSSYPARAPVAANLDGRARQPLSAAFRIPVVLAQQKCQEAKVPAIFRIEQGESVLDELVQQAERWIGDDTRCAYG